MADNRTVKANPRCVYLGKGIITTVPAGDAKTWKAGQFGYANAGLAEPVATDAVDVQYQFLDDQTTTTSGALVPVILLANNTVFEGYCSAENGGNDIDTAVTSANMGQDYGLKVGTNYVTVETSEVTNVAVQVVDYAPRYKPYEHTTSTSPGMVLFKFKDAVINA